jgi:hypothetical protein
MDRWLYAIALVLAAACAALIALSPFVDLVSDALVRPATYVAAAVAAVLFLRMLFDPKCHRGINAAKREMRGDRPFGFRWISFSDPQWGLFGSRAGEPALLWVRAVLMGEFILAMLLSGKEGSDILLLAFAAFFVAMMLSIIHVGMTTPTSQNDNPQSSSSS